MTKATIYNFKMSLSISPGYTKHDSEHIELRVHEKILELEKEGFIIPFLMSSPDTEIPTDELDLSTLNERQ